MNSEGELVGQLDRAAARHYVEVGTATGGMIPKLEAAISVLEGGVRSVHFINGTRPGALLAEIFTAGGDGTMISL